MKTNAQLGKEVIGVVEAVGKAYVACDAEAVVKCFSSKLPIVVIGTAKEDRRLGIEQLRKQVENDLKKHPKGYSMTLRNPVICQNGDTIWLAADCENRDMETNVKADDSRLTVVLVNEDKQWKIVQWHKSRPYGAGVTA
ncbi:MAG: nuclear transport factor 2 family protein [Deltaproteobacteria bacterium]|nr:nuclear transport factor 2 family protein [Deltaproteobacteria bacterium]